MSIELATGVAKRFDFLESSQKMLDWVEENPEETWAFIDFYDSLISTLNGINDEDTVSKMMPAVRRIRDTLEGRTVPLSNDFSGFKGVRLILKGLEGAKEPMRKGQEFKGKTDITPEEKGFAVLTPSMDTKNDALVFGTLGHLWERTFFAWAEERKFIPEGGWNKDNFLHALDETVMMQFALLDEERIKKKHPYIEYFTNSTQEGGLGWIKQSKIDDFSKKFWGELS